MGLENFLREGKKCFRRTLLAGLLAPTLFFNSCNPNPPIPDPPAPPAPSAELSENTEIVPEDYLEDISIVEEDSITFSVPVPYSAGDIIVCDISDATPDGLLRKVTSTSSDGKILYTESATLEEAIKNVDVKFMLSSESDYSRDLELSLLDFEKHFDNVVLLDVYGDYSTTYDQITLDGDISGSLNLILDLKISDNQLEEFTFKTLVDQEAYITVKAGDYSESGCVFDIWEKKFSPFIIGYIPGTLFPITVTPSLNFHLKMEGDLLPEVIIDERADLTAGIEYEKDIGWSTTEYSSGFWSCFPFGGETVSDFKILAGPELSLLVYGVAGPYGEINAYAGKFSIPPIWELRAGSEVNLGARMQIFGKTLADYSANIIDAYWVIAEGEAEEEDLLVIQPGSIGKDAYIREGEHYDGFAFSEVDGFSYRFGTDNYLTEEWITSAKSFIEFPLSLIQEDFSITSAKLKLFGTQNYDFSGIPISIKKVTEFWDENPESLSEGGPTHELDTIASTLLTGDAQWYEWDITSLVQGWRGGEPNYGIALIGGNRTQGDIAPYYFYSGDYGADITKRPKLEISYYE